MVPIGPCSVFGKLLNFEYHHIDLGFFSNIKQLFRLKSQLTKSLSSEPYDGFSQQSHFWHLRQDLSYLIEMK